MNEIVERNYRYSAAGSIWVVPELHLIQRDNGAIVVPKAEVDRVNRAVANQICGSSEPLTLDELEFLADVAVCTFADVAAFLGVHKSTLSKWRVHGSVPRGATSSLLKRWFWFTLFGDFATRWTASISRFRNDDEFLAYVHERAIQAHLADSVHQLRAS